ncbi:phosphoribosylformylglycinamidine cyclo-ligase [bacterium]|nr:MAG: phosphoribosylformylglycinamidine cyclo-ligase [bacterium]
MPCCNQVLRARVNEELQVRGRSDDDAYARAGVDIGAGNAAVALYRMRTAGWRHANQLDALGGFAGLFAYPSPDAENVLVGSADGVGTKILVAAALRRYDSVGQDLVNHCVNDILVTNATPLFFLDYLAVGSLDPEMAGSVVAGVHEACRRNNVALLGGETAEMPGLYAPGHFDLAGTIVGTVRRAELPHVESVDPGDAIVGLPSNGLQTNGYSLARSLIAESEWAHPFDGATFGERLLAIHPSFLEPVRAVQRVARVKAMAHITGGGLLENVPRTLREGVKAVFDASAWSVPAIVAEVAARAQLTHQERYRTLNMGIGFTLIVPAQDAAAALAAVPGAVLAGRVEVREAGEPAVVVRPPSAA